MIEEEDDNREEGKWEPENSVNLLKVGSWVLDLQTNMSFDRGIPILYYNLKIGSHAFLTYRME